MQHRLELVQKSDGIVDAWARALGHDGPRVFDCAAVGYHLVSRLPSL